MTDEELTKQVTELISKAIEIPVDKLNPDADFIEDLEIDSLKAIEITGALEKVFKIIIPEEKIRSVRTVNQAIALTKQILENQ